MKKKLIIIFFFCLLILFVYRIVRFNHSHPIITSEKEAAEAFLTATREYIEKNPNSELFDGTTNIFSFISADQQKPNKGNVIVKENGTFALKIYYDNSCFYKEYNDDLLSFTTNKKECDLHVKSYRETTSMYSWNNETLSLSIENVASLKDLNVNTLYQNIASEDLNKNDIEKIIKNYTHEGISVYRLIGDAEWTYDIDVPKNLINEVIEYNKSVEDDAKIVGITIDIEPHGSERWKNSNSYEKEKIFETYVKNMISLYDLAHQSGLDVVLCTNNWFSNYNGFTELYTKAADVFSIMNYDKRYLIENIKEELEIAEKNHKRIETIAHSGKSEDPFESYYDDTFDDLVNDQNQILNTYPYDRFRASYHYFPSTNYLKNKTILLSIYCETDDDLIPQSLYLIDENGKHQQGTLISLETENFFFFPNIKENHEYQIFSPDYTIMSNSHIMITKNENGRKVIKTVLGNEHLTPRVGDYVLYPYQYQNLEDEWESTSSLEGWRILSIDGDTIKLVSAGTPELYSFVTNPVDAIIQIEEKMQKYLLSDYALKAESLNKDMIDTFCNCDSRETSNIKQSIINNGSNLLLATIYNEKKLYFLENTGDIYSVSMSSKEFGLRPVITINANQLVEQDENKRWILSKK